MSISRRDFLGASAVGGFLLAGRETPASSGGRIDRQALVRRHNPIVRRLDPFAALTVGNGEFAFTADVTGLQTFPEEYREQFPLCTASHWGWHTTPLPPGLHVEDFRYQEYEVSGRRVGYATDSTGQEALFNWLRQNPHRLHLGRIGFELKKKDNSPGRPADLHHLQQTLDLWTGLLDSRFEFEGQPVHVQTCVHPEMDLLAVRVQSPLVGEGRLQVLLAFPYGSPDLDMADWQSADRHQTICTRHGHCASFQRILDGDHYWVSLAWSEGRLEERARHQYVLNGTGGESLEWVMLFSPKPHRQVLPSVTEAQQACRAHWERFWNEG
ncbi:MAG: twin-arginine translocation signal domain-containing protein, partial [Planctomycetes bacterium]|nr:twin-arginine translocation signal domain-containing protein [Planctomycetota bacterium]